MKKILFVCLLALLASAPQAAQAFQEQASSQGARRFPSPEEVVARLDEKLSLSDDQKAKITPIIADRQQKLKELAANGSGRRFQKARKMKAIYSESDDKIKALLSDDQKQKYSELQQQMREQMKQRRQQRANSSE